jgi:hypothetical protein
MSSMLKAEGPILGERYRLIAQLDAGGMGSVWVAEAVHLSSVVAVKIMDRGLAATPEAAQRFLREARTAASLRSPHVVQILDYGVQDGTPFIAMELLEGESLASRLAREGRLATWEQTELVLRHVARALARAHDAGVIHRDLKPANIFLVRDEEEEVVKLLDFGIAKTTAPALSAALASNTRTGEFLGSPAYASPEQLQGSKDLDHRADIWSLGVIAYECLLGRPPFASDSFVGMLLAICAGPLPVPSEQGPVPAGFDAWFMRACARDVELRFGSVREASVELRRVFGAASGSRAALAGPIERLARKVSALGTQTLRLVAPAKPLGPRRRVAALSLALALPAVVALVFFTLDASTSRAALDWKLRALEPAPPSEPARSDAPASVAPPALDARPGGAEAPPAGAPAPSPDPATAAARRRPSPSRARPREDAPRRLPHRAFAAPPRRAQPGSRSPPAPPRTYGSTERRSVPHRSKGSASRPAFTRSRSSRTASAALRS